MFNSAPQPAQQHQAAQRPAVQCRQSTHDCQVRGTVLQISGTWGMHPTEQHFPLQTVARFSQTLSAWLKRDEFKHLLKSKHLPCFCRTMQL